MIMPIDNFYKYRYIPIRDMLLEDNNLKTTIIPGTCFMIRDYERQGLGATSVTVTLYW